MLLNEKAGWVSSNLLMTHKNPVLYMAKIVCEVREGERVWKLFSLEYIDACFVMYVNVV